ncbi:hypothetical protein SCUCBS95973_006903 [Sporothrix curviconia]|uniref:Dead deah box DNA helicase n=1 Tax=Sporothrix curviconia TaxID=1260050 RepID=A0ABP0C904_9PEZI
MLPQGISSTATLDGASTLVPDVLFSGVDALFQRLAAVPVSSECDGIVVGHLSAKNFRAIEDERDRRGRHYRFFFLPEAACVIITIPTGPHERAHAVMYQFVDRAIQRMGLESYQWDMIAASKFTGPGGASGEGDSSGGPPFTHDGSVRTWPTVVIQSGVTQTLPLLRVKARWWFAASNYHMKEVVLVKVHTATSKIQIEKWVTTVPGTQRHGATNTRASSSGRRHSCKPRNRALADFHVDGTPLVLSFEALFERQPVSVAGEHDVLISEVDLQDLAIRVWDRAGLYK